MVYGNRARWVHRASCLHELGSYGEKWVAFKHLPAARLLNVPRMNYLVYTTRWQQMMMIGFKFGCVSRSWVEATFQSSCKQSLLSPQKRHVSILGVLNFKMYYGGYGGKWVAFKHYLLLDSWMFLNKIILSIHNRILYETSYGIPRCLEIVLRALWVINME